LLAYLVFWIWLRFKWEDHDFTPDAHAPE
jgi:hypothetical protein